jgi:hypothetical protein
MAATDMHATMEELLEAVFSVRSVPSLYDKEQLRLRGNFEMTEKCEVGVRWPSACEDISPGAEERPLVKTQQTETTWYVLQ